MSGLAGLDRKQMEAERLARASLKRPAPADDTTNQHEDSHRKRVKIGHPLERIDEAHVVIRNNHKNEDAKHVAADVVKASVEQSTNDDNSVESASQVKPAQLPKAQSSSSNNASISTSSSSVLQYPAGTLKRTWAYGHPRASDIKIEEVLQKNTLNTAIISSWQWDFDWLMTKFVPGKTKFVFAMEVKDDAEMYQRREEFKGLESMVRLVFPPMSKSFYSRMHSKLMLLFHPTYLRVMIPSANPTRHDWGEPGFLENTIFLIDLPRLSSPSITPSTPFQSSLQQFLRAQNFPTDVQAGVNNFDFSATADIAFIHSIPGTYSDDDQIASTGLPSLAKAIRFNSRHDQSQRVEIDFATSSLGALDDVQVASFVCALRGEDPFQTLEMKKKERSSGDDFRIVFPAKSTVQSSTGGPDAAGTIFFPTKTYNKPNFPRHLLHDYKSSREGLLSHNKIILTRTPHTAHIYHGSANLSASAWGRLTLTKAKKSTPQQKKMTVANWECGVLLPVVVASNASVEENRKVEEGEGVESEEVGRKYAGKVVGSEKVGQEDENAHVIGLEEVKKLLLERWGMQLPFVVPAKRYAGGEVPWIQEGGW